MADHLRDLVTDSDALRRLAAIEAFCETHLPVASEKSELVARRVLWAIRGSNDDPPHPDRRPGSASENGWARMADDPMCSYCEGE